MTSDSTLRRYVGVYERGTGDELNITFADGRFFGQRTGFAKREYVPMGEGIFYTNSSAATYLFVRDEHGALRSIEMLVFGRVLNFKRVN